MRRRQIDGYGAPKQVLATAIVYLGRDLRGVGGTVGVLAMLHTCTQRLVFDPHVDWSGS